MVRKDFLDTEGLEYVLNKIIGKINESVRSVNVTQLDPSQEPTASVVDGVLKLGIPGSVTDEHINNLIDAKLKAIKDGTY